MSEKEAPNNSLFVGGSYDKPCNVELKLEEQIALDTDTEVRVYTFYLSQLCSLKGPEAISQHQWAYLGHRSRFLSSKTRIKWTRAP